MQGAFALGFGRLPEQTTLGQPLDLRIPLRLDAGEQLGAECLSGSVSFADNLQQPGTTSLQLEPAPPGRNDRVLRLQTTTRVDEPVVNVEISVGCAARVTRRFTLFADPPQLQPAENLATLAPAAGSGEPPAGSTPDAAAPAPAEAAPAPAPRARAPARRRPAAATASAARTRPAARDAAPARPRLQLSPLEAGALIPTAAPAQPDPAASAAVAAAEAAASAASATAAAAAARVQALEAEVSQMRSAAASAQDRVTGLQSELQRLQADRMGPVSFYLLIGLFLLMLAAIAWLWRQRDQEREAGEWLRQASVNPREGTPEGDAATAEAVAFAPTTANTMAPHPDGGFKPTTASAMAVPGARPWSPSAAAPLGAPLVAEPKREVSVEELIDLEQQAEFFVVLGQDEAAIDLLMGHLRSTAGNSPLPYLKLLEIYKRRGDRHEYGRLRERFNSRFSAHAPDWDADLQDGRSLDDYPSVMGRLENLWPEPQRAMEVLQASLLRADAGSDAPTGSSFELPAYRELMLLYAVARDRIDSDTPGGGVDLLLPIGEADPDAASPQVFERLVATTSMEAQPDAQKPMVVDLTLEDVVDSSIIDFDPSTPTDEPPKAR